VIGFARGVGLVAEVAAIGSSKLKERWEQQGNDATLSDNTAKFRPHGSSLGTLYQFSVLGC